MPILPDPAYQQAAIAGPVTQNLLEPAAAPQKDQSALDVLAAAARGNVGGAAYDRVTTPDPDMPAAPPGWDPLDHVQGFEGYAHDLWDAQTPAQLEGRKLRIQRSQQDAEVLGKTGFWGKTGEMAFAGSDPSFLASIAVPEIRLARSVLAAKTATAIAHGAVAGAAYETEMQALKEGRSATESLYGVGSVALMSGVLGHLMAHVPPSKMKPIYDAIHEEAELARSEAGAAAVARPTTLSEESLARGGANLSRAFANTPLIGTDLDRIMASGNVSAHTAVQELADVPQLLTKNESGVATPRSVEAAVSKHDARLADFIDHAAEQWVTYAKRVPKEERISKRDFYENIAKASRRNDSMGIPEVDSAAKFLRQNIFDPLKDRALKLKLFENQEQLAGAQTDNIPRAKNLSSADQQIEDRFAGAVHQNPDALIDAYNKIPESKGGNVINTDLVRELSPDYLADRSKAAAVHEPASFLTKEIFTRKLAAAKPGGEVIFSAGGAGSGKSSGLAKLGIDKTNIVYDGTFSKFDGSVSAIDQALAAKQNARIVFTYREASDALRAALKRATNQETLHGTGRTVPLDAFEQGHRGARDVFEKLLEKYGQDDRVRFDVIDNTRGPGEARRVKFDDLPQVEYNGLREKLRTQVEAAHASGTISDAVRRGFSGPSESELGRLRAENRGQPQQERARRSSDDVAGSRGQSYFRRMYDRDVIRANLADWHQTLFNHFSKSGDAIPAEIHAAVDDVTNKILHADVGQSNFATKVTVPSAGPLKERTLDIPDEVIEKFLINDPQRVAQAYIRDLAPQVEMAQAFGDVDMKGRLGDISDEYAIQREKLRESVKEPEQLNKKLEKLSIEEKDTLEAVIRVRDRVLGRAGRISPDASEGARRAVNVSRGWRNLVASARLGGTAITGGVMDTAKIAAQYGFLPTITKLTQLVKSKAFRELSTAQARRVGSAVEAALSKRVQVAYDGAVTEGWTQTLANGVYKYTGLNHITDFNRTLAATLFEDSVLKAVGKMAEGKALPAFERARLASLGLGDKELAGVAQEIAKHGGDADGIRVSGSADWNNKTLADIYDSAILKESKIAVQQPGAADRVWWMDKETGKLIGQLKTFSLSSNARLLSGGLQMAGQGQYGKAARFFGYMMMGGYLTHVIRQGIAGKTPTTDPKTASFEAFSESGLGGVIPDLLSPVGRRLGVLGESVRYSDRNALSAYGGPALGAANDLYDFAFNRTQGGLSAKDLHMMRRMAPWNQVWWLRREINALEGEVAEGFDLQGADQATIGERMLRTEALPDKRDGAGIPVQ